VATHKVVNELTTKTDVQEFEKVRKTGQEVASQTESLETKESFTKVLTQKANDEIMA